MGKIGKISVIRKEVSNSGIKTLETGLRQAGMSRMPGTGVTLLPYREASGRYRTGLDENAAYLKRLSEEEREKEVEKILEVRERLEDELGVKLDPRSPFWNFSGDQDIKVNAYKLLDGDNLFDLDNPHQAIAYYWLKVHPRIASSFNAWERGEYPADTQFYVADEDVENEIAFKKKSLINRAIVILEDLSPEKRKKVARQLGLPISNNSKELTVYNAIDTLLKQSEFKEGQYKGQSTVDLFLRFAQMQDALLNIRDVVDQAITHSIYRVTDSGRIFEGAVEIADSKETLISKIYKDESQEERLVLEKKLSLKQNALK